MATSAFTPQSGTELKDALESCVEPSPGGDCPHGSLGHVRLGHGGGGIVWPTCLIDTQSSDISDDVVFFGLKVLVEEEWLRRCILSSLNDMLMG